LPRNTVNRKEEPSLVLSVRISQKEFRQFKTTMRILQIQGSSISGQLRSFLRMSYFRSLRIRRSRERIQRERLEIGES